jgi:hypothetical protein
MIVLSEDFSRLTDSPSRRSIGAGTEAARIVGIKRKECLGFPLFEHPRGTSSGRRQGR